MRRACVLGLFFLCGCVTDAADADSVVDPCEAQPTIEIQLTNACGQPVMPVPTRDQLLNRTALLARLVVTGHDPRRADGRLEPGAVVEFRFDFDAPGASHATYGGWFVSAVEAGLELDERSQSRGLRIDEDGEARDAVHCVERGEHFISARLPEYTSDGRCEPVDVVTQVDLKPTLRCLTSPQYDDECGIPSSPPDVDEAPEVSIRFVPLHRDEERVRFDGAVELRFQVYDADGPRSDLEVEFELTAGGPADVVLEPASSWTDLDGIAEATLTAGRTAGVVTVTAIVGRGLHWWARAWSQPLEIVQP